MPIYCRCVCVSADEAWDDTGSVLDMLLAFAVFDSLLTIFCCCFFLRSSPLSYIQSLFFFFSFISITSENNHSECLSLLDSMYCCLVLRCSYHKLYHTKVDKIWLWWNVCRNNSVYHVVCIHQSMFYCSSNQDIYEGNPLMIRFFFEKMMIIKFIYKSLVSNPHTHTHVLSLSFVGTILHSCLSLDDRCTGTAYRRTDYEKAIPDVYTAQHTS